jgi:hypothetical protein
MARTRETLHALFKVAFYERGESRRNFSHAGSAIVSATRVMAELRMDYKLSGRNGGHKTLMM